MLEKVDAIFFEMRPDFPIPVKTTRPEHALIVLTTIVAVLVWTTQRSGTGGLALVLICVAVGVLIYQLAIALSPRALTAPLIATLLGLSLGVAVQLSYDSFFRPSLRGVDPMLTVLGVIVGLISGYLAWSTLRGRGL